MKKSILLILLFASCFANAQFLVTKIAQIDTGFRQVTINNPYLIGIPYSKNNLTIYSIDSIPAIVDSMVVYNDSFNIPSYISTVPLSDSAVSLCPVNAFIAVGGAHSLMMVDMTAPKSADEIGSMDVSGIIQHVSFYNEVYAVEHDSTDLYYLLHVNMDNPYFPYSMDSIPFNFPISGMIVYNNYGYLLETQDSTSNLHIYDLNNDSALTQVAVISLPLYSGLDVNDTSVFLFNSDSISVYSLYNPVAPRYSYTFTSSGILGVAGIRSNECSAIYADSCNTFLNENGFSFIDTADAIGASLTVASYDSLMFYSTTTNLYIFVRQVLTGIHEASAHVNISVYPNPSSGAVNFDFASLPAGAHALNIFNLQGQLVLRKAISRNDVYKMDYDLESGTYLFEVTDENKLISSGKIVVQR